MCLDAALTYQNKSEYNSHSFSQVLLSYFLLIKLLLHVTMNLVMRLTINYETNIIITLKLSYWETVT